MEKQRLTYLLQQYGNDAATVPERQELFDYLSSGNDKELFMELFSSLMQHQDDPSFNITPYMDLARRASAIDKTVFDAPAEVSAGRRTSRVHYLRKWGWAAAIVLIAGVSAYFWLQPEHPEADLIVQSAPVKYDAAPGGDKAILTLADGSSIVLDSAANGSLALQGNMVVVKLADGRITYRPSGAGEEKVLMNTMRTPLGGQYQLTLPDGTRVWLNAASSITFPTAFAGKRRAVSVSGEVFLEVARNKEKPFMVDVAGKSSIEVLGTRFNVNSYPDEAGIRTTLIEGRVNVTAGAGSVSLNPGQQAFLASGGERLSVFENVDLEQTVAWKNGIFNFNKVSLEQAMRQIAKWYNVEVVYEKGIPPITFGGEMGRNLNLMEVLDFLSEMGVHFRLEAGRKVVVMP